MGERVRAKLSVRVAGCHCLGASLAKSWLNINILRSRGLLTVMGWSFFRGPLFEAPPSLKKKGCQFFAYLKSQKVPGLSEPPIIAALRPWFEYASFEYKEAYFPDNLNFD